MRICIIGNDGITLCRETPTAVNEGEVAVGSVGELRTAPLNGKRLLALWNALPGVERRKKVGDRDALIERIDVGTNQIDIHFRPTRLSALVDVAAPPSPSATADETQILCVPVRLRRSGREIRMLIDGTDPIAAAKPDARLIKLLIRACRFNASLVGSEVPSGIGGIGGFLSHAFTTARRQQT